MDRFVSTFNFYAKIWIYVIIFSFYCSVIFYFIEVSVVLDVCIFFFFILVRFPFFSFQAALRSNFHRIESVTYPQTKNPFKHCLQSIVQAVHNLQNLLVVCLHAFSRTLQGTDFGVGVRWKITSHHVPEIISIPLCPMYHSNSFSVTFLKRWSM